MYARSVRRLGVRIIVDHHRPFSSVRSREREKEAYMCSAKIELVRVFVHAQAHVSGRRKRVC